MKKKRPKKKPFDLDAALADGSAATETGSAAGDEPADQDSNAMDFDDNLDLESFGKKKKKKKKPFNLDEIENSLPSGEAGEEAEDAGAVEAGAGEEGDAQMEDFDLDVDFSKTKKKKKKKKDLDELVAEKLEEDIQTNKDNGKRRCLLYFASFNNNSNYIFS